MCGIVGMVGSGNVVPDLVAGLKRLEYRGYDSAGIAVPSGATVARVRAAGRIERLETVLESTPLEAPCGIGHTRWATHGRPTDANAHPHASCDERIALVHNGIIENYQALRRTLSGAGHSITTETDTEVLVHLIEQHLEACGRGGRSARLRDAVTAALAETEGVHAVAVVSADEPDRLVVAMNGPPVLVGLAEGSCYVASDLAPILRHARRVVFLEEGDVAEVRADGVDVFDATGERVDREPRHVEQNPVEAEKGGYKHFMLKEIHEQPRTIQDSLAGHVQAGSPEVELPEAGLTEEDWRSIERVTFLGCGTALHAGMVGARLVEALGRVPADFDVASEFRYRNPVIVPGTLAVAVTQSGETADTIAAMKEAKARGAKVLTVCNVLGSLATRTADGTIHTRAGLEIGVASTKAFTAQLVALTLLALRIARARGTVEDARAIELVEGLRTLPRLVEECLLDAEAIDEVARQTVGYGDYLYLGRGVLHALALEGALKLKEISYVHAEGYPAGEMKHGPIALIDENTPIVGLAPRTSWYEKTCSNLQEVKARDGRLVAIVTRGDEQCASFADWTIEIPEVDELLVPIVCAIPLQLLAYFVGVRRGCDVDQPRNLAKSVTVE